MHTSVRIIYHRGASERKIYVRGRWFCVIVRPIGQAMDAYRTERGITRMDMALEVGVTRNTLRKLERGGNMKLDTAAALAGEMDVSLDELYLMVRRERKDAGDARATSR